MGTTFFCLRKELKWEVQIWHAAVTKLWGTVYCIIMAARRCSWGYTGLDFCGMSKAHFAVLIWPLVDGSVSQTLKLRTSNVIKTKVLRSTPRPEPRPRPPRPRPLSIQQGRNTSAAWQLVLWLLLLLLRTFVKRKIRINTPSALKSACS